MRKIIVLLTLVFCARAQQIRKVPVRPTPPTSGAQMFSEYCAICHGEDGRGGGPAAAALKEKPVDLTQLRRKNRGKFPDLEVMNFITGSSAVAVRDHREMPVWGDLFRALTPHDQALVRLRVTNLKDYVKSLQAR